MKPSLTVIVVTGRRREFIGRAAASVLASEAEGFDLLVVDIAPTLGLPASLGSMLDSPKLRYVRGKAKSSTAAHNEAIAQLQSPYVAVTDDDCEVSKNWIESIEAAFEVDTQIGVVFGNVHPVAPDSGTGRSPCYLRKGPFLAREVRDKSQVEGIWASMAFRRDTWQRLGGFDDLLGAGARFPGGADGDFALRALARGIYVYETPAVSVVHHRLISPQQGKRLAFDYSRGSGAMMAKHLKCRTQNGHQLLATLARRWLRGVGHTASSGGGRLYRAQRVAGFLSGFAVAAFVPVDHDTCRFRTTRST